MKVSTVAALVALLALASSVSPAAAACDATCVTCKGDNRLNFFARILFCEDSLRYTLFRNCLSQGVPANKARCADAFAAPYPIGAFNCLSQGVPVEADKSKCTGLVLFLQSQATADRYYNCLASGVPANKDFCVAAVLLVSGPAQQRAFDCLASGVPSPADKGYCVNAVVNFAAPDKVAAYYSCLGSGVPSQKSQCNALLNSNYPAAYAPLLSACEQSGVPAAADKAKCSQAAISAFPTQAFQCLSLGVPSDKSFCILGSSYRFKPSSAVSAYYACIEASGTPPLECLATLNSA